MITREFGDYECYPVENAPPPLHVAGPPDAWYPVERMVLRPQPPGPIMVTIPISAPFGDDPTDPNNQTEPRIATAGMVGFLNARPSAGSVRGAGVRS